MNLTPDCYTNCSRCTLQGVARGKLDRYAHVLDGVCFLCQGSGRRLNKRGKLVYEVIKAEEKVEKLSGGKRNVLKDAALALAKERLEEARAALAA